MSISCGLQKKKTANFRKPDYARAMLHFQSKGRGESGRKRRSSLSRSAVIQDY